MLNLESCCWFKMCPNCGPDGSLTYAAGPFVANQADPREPLVCKACGARTTVGEAPEYAEPAARSAAPTERQ